MKTQEQVLEELFDSKGYSNYLEATFFLRLGEEIHDERPKSLRKTFPIPNKIETEEWQRAYGLVNGYLESKQMDLTRKMIAKAVKGAEPTPEDELLEGLKLKSTKDPLQQLLKVHKIRHLLDPKTIDFKIESQFYRR